MIGKKISHYEILEKLGEGGMPSIIKKYNSLVPPEKRWRTGPRGAGGVGDDW